MPPTKRASISMAEGHAGVTAFGAATAIIAALDVTGSEVGVANLGDSSLRQLRRLPGAPMMTVIERTQEQQHKFGQPFQLSRIPTPNEYPELVAAGKTKLVQAVKAATARGLKLDEPEHAQTYSFEVEEGDLFILGSDGLFDNLDDTAMLEIVTKVSEESPEDLPRVAEELAREASRIAATEGVETPFSKAAVAAGYQCVGGVVDDITVIVARISKRSY